jgi:5'-nucleotidase
MKFLLVNDDGYGSEGITLLENKLKKYGEVYVVAPKEHQSGKSSSLVYGREINLEKIDDHHFKVDATPVNCVIVGLFGLGINFDMVISGCNDGFNMSLDTMYSGTIGACIQSLFSKIPAIAFSTKSGHFEEVDKNFDEVFEYILEKKIYSCEYLLNVNFPMVENIKGIKLTSLHQPVFKYDIDHLEYSIIDYRDSIFDEAKKGSDVYEVHNGYVSITPLNKTTFDSRILSKVKKII